MVCSHVLESRICPHEPMAHGKLRTGRIRVYTTAEVARRLKVNKMTVMRWVRSSRVKKPKIFMRSGIGTTWLWTKEELARVSSLRDVLFYRAGGRLMLPRIRIK